MKNQITGNLKSETLEKVASKGRGGRPANRLQDATPTPHESATKTVTKPHKRRRRGDNVRVRLMLAALDCFSAFGFEGTSTRAIADRAKATHSLVLYHFQSKEQLWIETMEMALSRYMADISPALTNSEDVSPDEAMRAFIATVVRMSAAHPQVHRILTMESSQNSDRLQFLIDGFLRNHFAMACDLIRRGQQHGTVRLCDPARLYYFIIGGCGTMFTIATEYKQLTGRDVFSEIEILRNTAFIYELVFKDQT